MDFNIEYRYKGEWLRERFWAEDEDEARDFANVISPNGVFKLTKELK